MYIIVCPTHSAELSGVCSAPLITLKSPGFWPSTYGPPKPRMKASPLRAHQKRSPRIAAPSSASISAVHGQRAWIWPSSIAAADATFDR